MAKAKDAFRTISEVAEWLDTPTHVLRFWETKFSQIRPVKGAGGRRYYRPSDMDLLGGIKQLLHEDGLTIKGTQKLLREKGVKYVAALGPNVTTDQDPANAADTPVEPEATKVDVVPSAPTAPIPPAQIALPFDSAAPAPAPRVAQAPLQAEDLRAQAAQIEPLLARLEHLRDRMRTR
ncbi:MAG: MerR family transcriptional regulator [Loktanella sp.]|nr:MerR family transcriptional regulator [Loktanella sp.]